MSVLNKVNVISSIGYDCKICQKFSYERQESIAGVFSTYAHSWLTCGPELFVVNNSDGVLQSYWTFGENLQDDLEITCAVELPLEGCAIPLLILGISSENVNLICFFNPNTRKILRTIDIIYPVRTICVIEDGTNEVYPLNDTLTPTEGLIAVGCAEGTILLIDLCRSILCKAVNGDFRFYSTEENPSEAVYVGINSITSGTLSQKIVESRKKKNCVSVILTDPSDEGITALLYSIESAVLFVGTSSGSFHLWNMSSLSCLFKSPGTNRAIISLSLLEPCDDPRHSLYLWICFEQYAQVAMYCISFSSKFFVHGYGVYYQNFESAGLVYRFTLGMEVDVIARRPICSQAVAKLVPKNLVRCISLPEAEGTHLRLFITAYEIIDKGQVSIRAVIFDLNQWYRDQMPEEGISACLDSIDLDCKSLWHLQLDPSSLTLYQCVRPQEQHFHPTAFDFQVWCIEEEGVRCLEKLGLQTQWLRNMSRMGSKALVEPTQIFLGALAAGLLPSFVDPPDPEANNEVEERSYVLTICLENRIIMVIEDCVKDWNNGGYTVRGCTIQFLLDWLWSLHRTYKTNGNKICIPLFDQSGMKFDVSEKRSLQHCKSLLNTVQSVYTNIVNRYKNTIIISGVEEKLTAMSLVRLYFDCCLKLISVNLLPEPNDLGRPSDSVVYHFDKINTYAINRRRAGPFLGDSLLGKTEAEKQWLEEGGTGLYPPPSIQSVLRFCLHPAPSIANKMSLLLYLFMDIINSYTPIRGQPVIDRIKNFQHLMRIPEVQYKIVAGCWYFDHSMFDEGVDLIFDPRVLCVDLNEDQHRGILHLLASEGQEKLALQYLRLKSPTLNLANDLRMELNLLLSNGLVNEAFLFQRKHPEMRETLLIEFFEGCIERKQLGQVFGLNLDYKEEATLMKYLRSSGLKEKGDLQVLLLLSKAKYTEAMFLNDKLNSSINGPKSRIETDTRDMIVRGITGSLNTISRHMANEMKTYRPPPAGSHPRPLSSLIKVRNGPDGPTCQTDCKVLLSAVAKSTRHLSDFVNSFESGLRRKRDEKDTDIEFDHEPSRKKLKFWDTTSDVNKVPSLKGRWLTSSEPSASQERDVMELVGTPLVKKRGKRFSPQSKPSSILKGKTPEKSIITEDFGETPKKTIRFTLPENETQITGRKPLRENETSVSNQSSKITVDIKDEFASPVAKEFSKPPHGLGKPSARKPLHGSDNLNNSVASHDSSSVIETIKDRLRSSAKKKVLEDGVNWHEVAEASKPRVLFTQGVSKITSVTKSVKTPSPTPTSQALLDITVTSSERKYIDSPSRGKETSPITETLFNTTLLPKALFPSVNKEKEVKENLPELASMHAAFLERYKQLRNKNIKSSNGVATPEEEKERGAMPEDQSLDDACTKKTVEPFKSSKATSSVKIVIEDTPKKESVFNKSILKEKDDGLDKQLVQQENKLELPIYNDKPNDGSLLEGQEVYCSQIQKESLSTVIEHFSMNDKSYKNAENSLNQNNPLLKDDVSSYKDQDDVQENQDKVTEWCSLKLIGIEGNCSYEERIDNCLHVCEFQDMKESQICHDVISNDENGLNESEPPIEVYPSEKFNSENEKDENELLNDKEMSKKELSGDYQCNVTNTSFKDKSKEDSSNSNKDCEEIIDIASDDEDDNEDKQSYDESLSDEESERMSGELSEEIEEEMSEKEENEGSLPDVSSISSDGDDVGNSEENISDDVRNPEENISVDCRMGNSEENISDVVENPEENISDVENPEENISDVVENPEENISDDVGNPEENISDDVGNSEENISDDVGNSEENISDDVGNSEENISVDCFLAKSPKKKIKKIENVPSQKGQTGKMPIVVLSDDDSGDETSKKKKKGSGKKISNVKTGEPKKTKSIPQHEQHYEEDVSDSEVFGLKNDKIDSMIEENSDDDMWIGLDDKESSVSKKMKKPKQEYKCKEYDQQKTENFQKPVLRPNLDDSHKKESEKKRNLKPFPSTKYSRKKSFSGSNHPNIIKDDVEHDSLNNIDIPDKNSISGLAETSILYEGLECDILPIVSNPVSGALSEQELIENSSAVSKQELIKDSLPLNIPEDKVVTENQQVTDNFFVEDPILEAVSSFTVERPANETISEEKILAEESEPDTLPLITRVSSFNNEDISNEKSLGDAKEEIDLEEDYRSIEQNWTQQIEEEMKQDSVILKIESDNNDLINNCNRELLNVDASKLVSNELNDSKSINKSECKGLKNSTVVSSLETLQVEHNQNNILISDKLRILSRSLEIDGKDFSIRSTTNLSFGDNALAKDISRLNKADCVLPESEKNNKENDLVIAAGTHKEIIEENIVSCSKEFELPQDKTNETNLKVLEVSAEALEKQSVIILKENDRHEENKIKATLYDTNKANDCHNSKVSHLNPKIDNQPTAEDHDIIISKHNNDSETSATILPQQENLSKHSDDSFKTVQEINFSSDRSSSFSIIEKCKLSGDNQSHLNLISMEGKADKLYKNIGECSNKSLYSEKRDSVGYKQDHTHITVKGNKDVSISMTPASKEIKENDPKLEHEEESTKTKTFDKNNSKLTEKNSGNCTIAGDIKVMHSIKEISDEVESKNFGTTSEIIHKNLNEMGPSSSLVKIESFQMKDITPSKQENNDTRVKRDDKVLAGSNLAKDNDTKENIFEHPVEVINSDNMVPGLKGVSNNTLNEYYNISKIDPTVHETNANEDGRVIEENISLSVDKDVNPQMEPLNYQLNKSKLDICNDSSTSDTLHSPKKLTNDDVEQNVSSAENNCKISYEKSSTEKSFFFGKEDIETYIRSTKATFQIGGRLSLPEEDEPIDPMEVAMIEEDEKIITKPSSTEQDFELSLHLSPERLRKPEKVDQGIVTENSYLQRRARKLRKSVKKLETDESSNNKIENKILNPEDHISNILSVEKELKCISTQTSDDVLDEIDLSESEEEVIDYTKISGPSQKSVELKRKISRTMRQSSEPPLTHKENIKRKSSVCHEKHDLKEERSRDSRHPPKLFQEQDIKGILKNKDSIENFDQELKTRSKSDHLPVRRSRRLSECVIETNELLRNQCEKDLHIKSRRRHRGYSEEPDFYSISSYEEPEIRASLDEYTSRRRSRRISEEADTGNKYPDDRRRSSKNLDDSNYDFTNFKQSEEPEIRSILKRSSKGSRKSSLSCETINELKNCENRDSIQASRKLRCQSEEPESLGTPKKRHRQSRRSSCTYDTAADLHSQVEEISVGNRKIQRQSEGTEIQGILKKRNSNKSRSSLLSDVADEIKVHHKVDRSEESRESRKHSEIEIRGILKRSKKECRSSDNETDGLKLFSDDFPERNRRGRRHSEEPEMLKSVKRRGSQSSDFDNEINLLEGRWEGSRQMRRHSEEPEVQGISQKRNIGRDISRKSLYTTETACDLKSNVKGILKKSKRRNSSTGETEKGTVHHDSDYPEHKNSHLLDYDSPKGGKKVSDISRKTDSINGAKTQEYKSDEDCLSTNKNKLKNQTCLHVSGTNDKNNETNNSDGMVTDIDAEPKESSLHSLYPKLQTEKKDADESENIQKVRDCDNKAGSSSSTGLVSENKKSRKSNIMSHEAEPQPVKESPAKGRRRSSSSVIAKEEPVEIISLPEGGSRNIRKSLRRTPDKKEDNTKVVEDKKRKVEPQSLKLVPKRLDYSDDDESPKQKKSRSLIDFPIKRNSRLPRPALEDIREEDEDLLKKKKKSLDDFHIEEMKKKASKKQSISKLVIADSDCDSDVSTPELWKKDSSKEKRLTRTQQKLFLMNQQLTSISEVESPSTSSSPRRSIRKKADAADSPLKTPTRSSLRLQKKPPSETD